MPEIIPPALFADREFRASVPLRMAIAHAKEFGRAVVLAQVDARHVMDEVEQLRAAVVVLAHLASDTPQFNNPLVAWDAVAIRDRVLADVPAFLGYTHVR